MLGCGMGGDERGDTERITDGVRGMPSMTGLARCSLFISEACFKVFRGVQRV